MKPLPVSNETHAGDETLKDPQGRTKMKAPVVELSACIRCSVCVAVCPEVFSWNPAGYIEVADLPFYPEEGVNEAVTHCPTRCIYWDEA